jgi:glutaredoxin
VSVTRVTIVLAQWCPHCVPLSQAAAQRMASDLGVPLRVLDIALPEQEAQADRLVAQHGDFVEDYIIPQVFLEFADGTVRHVFTGFSEGVAVTATEWRVLFSSRGYRRLVDAQHDDRGLLRGLVASRYAYEIPCRGHCRATSTLRFLPAGQGRVVGAYCCPDGYVSRIVYFSCDPDVAWFQRFLAAQLGGGRVQTRDLRLATRGDWVQHDVAVACPAAPWWKAPVEVYWTRYPKTPTERALGIFLCRDGGQGCRRLFVQNVTGANRLCPECRNRAPA